MINEVLTALQNGDCAIAPTDTVYGLLADASNLKAIEKLYALKQRPSAQPLQILVNSLEMAQQLAHFSPEAEKIAQNFWAGSLTIILPRRAEAPICPQSCGDQSTIGLRFPNSKTICELIDKLGAPLAASSVNLRGHPPLTNTADIRETFPQLTFMQGHTTPLASTVIEVDGKQLTLHREGTISHKQLLECIA